MTKEDKVKIAKQFELSFGLKINWSKSGLADINVDSQALSSMASLAGCKFLGLPFVYLGVPLDGNLRSIFFLDPIV